MIWLKNIVPIICSHNTVAGVKYVDKESRVLNGKMDRDDRTRILFFRRLVVA
jgi:hypothetical protein